MSIRDDLVQKVLGNPGMYSVEQLQQAMQAGTLPAYIVVPIIQDKVQQQKQMQMAQAMQEPSPEEQPPIAEQIMQEAAQMGGGVDQLPTNLPQEYASGGIVAFGGGGEVERYNSQGLIDPSFIEAAARQQQDLSGTFSGYETEERKKRRWNPFTGSYAPLTPEQEAQLVAAEAELKREYGATPSAPAPSTQLPTGLTRPDIMTGTAPRAAGPGAAPASIAGLGGDFKRKSAVEEWQRQRYGTEIEPGLEARTAARQRELDEKIAAQQVPGLAYEGYEKALQKEEQARGVEKDEAKYTAMIKAGLAMMAGTSANAFENIGKGAMVGLDDWQRAAKDIKKAEKEHRMMMAQIEQARRAEKIGDRDRMIARLESATKHAQRMDELGVEGYMRAFGVDQDAAQDAWGKRFSAATQIQIARDKGDTSTLLGLMRMGAGGERGAMTVQQRGDKIRELERSQEALKFREQLLTRHGSRAESTPEFKRDFDDYVLGLYNRYYGSAGQSSAPVSGLTEDQMSLIRKYVP
jgi:tetratricopeptide (TPR) repeat protein